jgi:asparagine synthase (glutamine-hydrolysing)
MCGLVAVLRRDGAPVKVEEILSLRETMLHRGPDDAGVFVEGNVGLGHRRLRIIDLSGGRQPMANGRASAHIVFNGEIYNYRELRRLLEGRGVRLRTQSDTETILGLYDLFGDDCVHHLRGMFAFVLWDATRRRLLAARDRLGIKPLYVARRGNTVALASEIKALLPILGGEASIDVAAVPEYLVFRNLAGTRTLVRGIERVAPGELLVFDDEGERRQQYWTLPTPVAQASAPRRLESWSDELDALLADAVLEHMVSDVPLGTFNSGGVDSSLITAYAARHAGERLNTYSVGFDDPAYDERPFALAVAERFATRHHTLVVSGREYADWLPRAVWHHDEPLNHPHSVQLALLSRLAREKVTVVLTGEGADELFGGYPRYRLASLLDRCARIAPVLLPLIGATARWLPERGRLRTQALLNGGRGLHVERLAAFVGDEAARRVLAGLPASTYAARDAAPVAEPPWLLSRALAFDQQTYLQSLLNRMDKMSMAASLEGRVPFLDHRIVEFAAQVPPALKVRWLQTKRLLKHTAGRYLPAQIIDRSKAGFAVPVAEWLRSGGALDEYLGMLLEPRARARGWLADGAVAQLVGEHRAGVRDHGELLWGLINLELWQRVLLEDPPMMVAAQQPATETSMMAGVAP